MNDDNDRVIAAKERFERTVQGVFPELYERMNTVVEDFIQRAYDAGNDDLKASMFVLHQVVGIILGRMEGSASAAGVPMPVIERMSKEFVERGRGMPLLSVVAGRDGQE